MNISSMPPAVVAAEISAAVFNMAKDTAEQSALALVDALDAVSINPEGVGGKIDISA